MRKEYQIPLPADPADQLKLDRWVKAELAQGRKVVHYGGHGMLRVVSLPQHPTLHPQRCP